MKSGSPTSLLLTVGDEMEQKVTVITLGAGPRSEGVRRPDF